MPDPISDFVNTLTNAFFPDGLVGPKTQTSTGLTPEVSQAYAQELSMIALEKAIAMSGSNPEITVVLDRATKIEKHLLESEKRINVHDQTPDPRLEETLDLLAEVGRRFREYEKNHNAKVTPENVLTDEGKSFLKKAARNREMAERIEEVVERISKTTGEPQRAVDVLDTLRRTVAASFMKGIISSDSVLARLYADIREGSSGPGDTLSKS